MDREMDEELRKRLTGYTREPNERLWENIAPHISIRQKNGINRMGKGIDLFTVLILVACLLSILLNLSNIYPAYSEASVPGKENSQQTIELKTKETDGANNVIKIEAIVPLVLSSKQDVADLSAKSSNNQMVKNENASEIAQSALLGCYDY